MNKYIFFSLLFLGISSRKVQSQNSNFQEKILGINNTMGVYYSSVAFADIDNDNDLDLMITGLNDLGEPMSELFLNDDSGNYSIVPDTPFQDVDLSSIAFADVDGDNDPDLMITGSNSSNERISELYTNDGFGNFSLTDNIFQGVERGSIAFADIDSDNDLDLIITGRKNNNDPISELYTNDGSGGFSLKENTPFTGVRYGAVAFADIDGDNDLDLIITGRKIGDNPISELYTNDGMGNFSLVADTPFSNVAYGAVAFADVDADNDLDLMITGSYYGDYLSELYTNDGTGNFNLVNDTPFQAVIFSAIKFGDIDGDNDQDLFISGQNNDLQHISEIYINDSSGNYNLLSDTPFPGVIHSSVVFTDVDNDNDLDLMISGNNNGLIVADLYTNDGTGNYNLHSGSPFQGVDRSSIAFADIDNDNDLDVLITGHSGNTRYNGLYVNDGTGDYSLLTDTTFHDIFRGSIAFADIDNDNDLDLMITGRTHNNLIISDLYTNDGIGNFNIIPDTPFQKVYASAIAFADVDNDLDLDLMITGRTTDGHTSNLYTNDGLGNYELVVDSSFQGISFGSIAFADIDGDNDLDLMIAGRTADEHSSKLYTNDGLGNYSLVTDNSFPGLQYSSVAFADLDGDNDQDLMITGQNNSSDAITELYTNNGLGDFSLVNTTFDGVENSAIAFNDIDGDNDLDFIITGETNSNNKISKLYTNNGMGNFNLLANISLQGVFRGSTVFADVNNDGFPDLMLSGKTNSGNITKLYMNIPYAGTNYFVSESGSGIQDGTSIENAAPTVGSIINSTALRDSVKIIDGTILENQNVSVPNNVTIHIADNTVWNMQSNNLTNNGNVIVKPTANFVQETNSEIIGDGTFEIIRQAGTATNMLNILSSPIDEIDVQQVYGGSNVIAYSPAKQSNGSNGWEYITSGNLTNGKGYAVSGSILPNSNGKHYYNGKANNGVITINLDGTNYGGLADGWNLIGNPYPSSINLNALLTANDDIGAVTFYNQTADMYTTYNILNGAGIEIASGQGFFIEFSSLDSGIATFTNDLRTNNSSTILKSASITKSTIQISNTDGESYKSFIAFTDNASDQYEIDYDAHLIPGANELTIYSLLNEDKLAIQALSSFSEEKRIPIGFESLAGQNEISLLELENFPEDCSVFLIDHLLNITHNLKENSYNFVISDHTTDEARFELLYKVNALDISNVSSELDLKITGNKIELSNSSSIKKILLYDLMGQLLQQWDTKQQNVFQLDLNHLPVSVYFIEFTSESNQFTKKLSIIK